MEPLQTNTLPEKPARQDDGTFLDLNGNTVSQEVADDIYAAHFWAKQKPGVVEGLRQVFSEGVTKSADSGEPFGIFVNPAGIDENAREKMSAYRQTARELGFEMGQFQYNPNADTVTTLVTRPQR